MMTLDDVRFFQILVRAGTMAAAARELNVSPPAVTQRLQQMEARYGLLLVDRSTRRMRLTDEGELLYERGAAICADTDELFDLLKARSGAVAGHLRISAPLGFGRRHLAGLAAEFHAAQPGLKLTLSLFDRLPTPDADAADVVFYIGALRDSRMVQHMIAPNRRLLCAAPKYLRLRGHPGAPEDLAQHLCLSLRENNEDVTLWKFGRGRASRHVRIDPTLASNDGEVVRQWMVQGRGIAVRSEWDVAELLGTGKLVHLLPEWELSPADIVALVPQRKGMSARAKAFIAFVRERFSPHPPWRM